MVYQLRIVRKDADFALFAMVVHIHVVRNISNCKICALAMTNSVTIETTNTRFVQSMRIMKRNNFHEFAHSICNVKEQKLQPKFSGIKVNLKRTETNNNLYYRLVARSEKKKLEDCGRNTYLLNRTSISYIQTILW